MDTTLNPIPNEKFGAQEARHLLLRAGFGAGPRKIAEVQELGLDAAVDSLVGG